MAVTEWCYERSERARDATSRSGHAGCAVAQGAGFGETGGTRFAHYRDRESEAAHHEAEAHALRSEFGEVRSRHPTARVAAERSGSQPGGCGAAAHRASYCGTEADRSA